MRINRKITQERMRQKMSKCELARRTGLTYQTINNIEKGKVAKLDSLEKIFNALGLELIVK